MDKLPIAIFFLFFTLSFARTPLTQQVNDITNLKLPVLDTLPESDATPTNQIDKETHVQENQDHLPEPKDKKIKALPLTLVRISPINHHFRVRSRRPVRPCHHHHFHHAHNLKPRTTTHLDDQIPYDNDIIVSSGENNDFDHVVFHGGMHDQVPEELISFLHHDNEDNEDDDEQKLSKFIIKRNNHDKFGKMKLKDHFYELLDDDNVEEEDDKISAMQHEDHQSFDKKKMKKHLHHHNDEDQEEQEAEDGNEAHKEEKKKGGFVRHIRKFLDNYFE